MESEEKQNRAENGLSPMASCDPATEATVESSVGDSSSSPATTQTEAEAPAPAGEVRADLSEAHAKLLTEKNEIYDRLLRKQAELENLRKRFAREKEEFSQYLGEKWTRDLLPLLDGFERALSQKSGNVPEEYYRGTELLYRELGEVLRRAGLSPVEAKGKPFDPHLHQAVESVESTEHPDHEVLEELQKGYKFKQRLLRPSLVRVAIRPVPASSGENPEK